MALVLKDRVQETSTTTGTGTLTLAGAVTQFQTFSAAVGNGNTTYYTIYNAGGSDWEVGIGTVGAGTLARTTVLASSNAGAAVNFTGTLYVFGDYPADKAVYQDANGNVAANAFDDSYTNVAATGTTTTLTVASVRRYTVTGSGGQTFKLPNATTLTNGVIFEFDNNQSSGAITVNNNSNTLVVSVPSGGVVRINLLSNATSAGSWDRHDFAPANVSWSTNTLDYPGSITSATWNGSNIALNRGGTNASLTASAGSVPYSTASALALSAVGTSGQVLTSQGTSAPTWTTPTTGTVTSVTGTAPVVSSGGNTPAISMPAATGSVNGYLTSADWTTFNNKGSGSVTSVNLTASTGISVSGGPITSSGSITVTNTAPMTYPGAGIANSTGSAWGTSYTTTGSGTVVALATTPSITNPTVTNYVETLYAPSAGSSFTVDLANGTVQKLSLNANGTITLPSSVAGKSFVIIVTYSGAFTLTWAGGSTIKWPSGTAPTASSASGKFDIFTFFQDGTNTYGNSFGLNY